MLVIHEGSFNKAQNYLQKNKDKIIYGGKTDDNIGYYVEPSLLLMDSFEDVKRRNIWTSTKFIFV